MTKGSAARWAHDVEVAAKTSEKDAPYVVDEIAIPPVTPWNSWMRLSGFDFYKDGKRAAVSTWNGDVWIVSGIGDDLGEGKLKWRRIATGLFQPLGVRVIDEVVHLACRDQLVSTPAIRRIAARLPDARLHVYGREAAHEILRELDPVRLDALGRIDRFLDEVAR